MLFTNVLAALFLATGIAAVPAGKSILGYRVVSKAEADRINAAGAPVWDGQERMGGHQIGPGIHTSPYPGAWLQDCDEWICVIYTDSNALQRVSKVWVPQKAGGIELWWSEDTEIDNYTKSINKNWTPAKTLKMSYISGFGVDLQLVIPPALVRASGGMGLSATCKKTARELPDSATVVYSQWRDIGGSRGSPDS